MTRKDIAEAALGGQMNWRKLLHDTGAALELRDKQPRATGASFWRKGRPDEAGRKLREYCKSWCGGRSLQSSADAGVDCAVVSGTADLQVRLEWQKREVFQTWRCTGFRLWGGSQRPDEKRCNDPLPSGNAGGMLKLLASGREEPRRSPKN